ncbi:MAG: autotransporter assembly complex protein TamA [Pseudomonadota bacterium]|jgi:translocation and assembly module TamA|nr:BamA/TamA family outer membrane protein [Alphaproteobacteria bacterium]
MQYFLFIIFFLNSFLLCGQEQNVGTTQEGIHYTVEWPKDLAPEIIKRIESVSVLLEHQSRSPGSLGGLMKRIEKDKILLEKTLHSFGYYGCKIDVKMNLERSPILIEFMCDLGPLYTVSKIQLDNVGETDLPALSVDLSDLVGLTRGDVLIAENAQKSKVILKKYFAQSGYPFAEIDEPEGSIDHSSFSVVLIYPVDLGKRAVILDSEIESTGNLNRDYIKNRLFWNKGDVYDNRVVERTRRQLSQTGLFDNIVVTPKLVENSVLETATEQPVVMHVKATEAPPRAVTAGVHYATSQGGEARFSWNHYNLAGGGENLGTALRFSTVRSKARLYYNMPDFGAPKQTLKNETYAMKENTRAYKSNTLSLLSKIERQFNDIFSGSLGLSGETGNVISKTTDKKSKESLLGTPIEIGVDTSNDLLNPTRGFRINGNVTPYGGSLGSSKGMLIGQASASLYIPFRTNSLDEDMGVLASFVKFGTIRIRNFDDLPPNKRFYGGGNGSVRGYGYQLISPVDQNRVPLGGESLLEFGGELRYRFTETIGGVAFLEAGSVSQRKLPSFGQKLLWGTGFGVRYYTAYAPVRVDIAFPLKKRKIPGAKRSYDRAYQFYVSVGQAF